MTREEILSIEEYCAEHKISHKKRLEERTTSSAETMTLRSEQPSYTHSSAAARHMMLMFDRGWRIHSEESLQKRTLTSYYLATGRHYTLIAGNNQLLPGTTSVMAANWSICTLSYAYLNQTISKHIPTAAAMLLWGYFFL